MTHRNETSDGFPLSVVILARNEESNIERCVRAVAWCNDIVVVDDRSTDRTVENAISAGARVLQHSFVDFATQRNWAMAEADLKNDWVLHLDADEVVTEELHAELVRILPTADASIAAFRMCRKTILGRTWLKYSDGFPVWIMRLVRRGAAAFQSSGHGEVAVPAVQGGMGTVRVPFLHFAFSKGWADWINRHNRYSTHEAEAEVRSRRPIRIGDLFASEKEKRRLALRELSRRLPCRPCLRFLYQYFLKCGFLDGPKGLVFCTMMAAYERWIVLKRNEMLQSGWHKDHHDRDRDPEKQGMNFHQVTTQSTRPNS